MQDLLFELRLILRQLLKAPGYTITALLTLAFGIGITTTIFSIVEAVLLRPLPFPDSGRLMILSDRMPGFTLSGINGTDEIGVAAPEIKTYTRETHGFSSLGGYIPNTYELSGIGDPAQVIGARLAAGVLPALGVQPQLGRFFTVQEQDESQQVALLSHTTWVNRFHRDPRILGTKILLDRKPYIIIGVMPSGFEFPLAPGLLNRSELWVPLSYQPYELASNAASNWVYFMVGRLKPGVTPRQAQDDAEIVVQEIMRGFPSDMASVHLTTVVRPLQEETIELARPLLRTLFMAVGVVLLIACANLAGLMLVRAVRRQHEVAIRLAVGARVSALLRHAVLESLVLSVTGGMLGLGAAALALRVGRTLLPESLPRITEIGLDWWVVGFAFVLCIFTGFLCGLVPAFAALRTDVNGILKEGGRSGSAGGGHARLRSSLVVAEISIAFILVAASGLLLRSFEKMRSVDLGYRPDHIATAYYTLPPTKYGKQPQVDAFNRELLTRLGSVPGVTAAGFTTLLPPVGSPNSGFVIVDGGYTPPKGGNLDLAFYSQVIGNFFPALDIHLERGRIFTPDDRAGRERVLIVSHHMAQHYWPGQDPIGRHIRWGSSEMHTPWITVVGVASDVKLTSPDQAVNDQYYIPVDQIEDDLGPMAAPIDLNGFAGYVVLRSTLPPKQMENVIRATVRNLDPQLALTGVETMDEALSSSEAPRRFNTVLISSFAFAAVLLAVLGIYSIIAFSVASRSQEMAIRMALGSQKSAIVSLVVRSGAILAAIGCVIGIAGAIAAAGLMRSLLFAVSPFDPLVLVLSAIGVLMLAVVASILPAMRAAAVNPIQALRGE